MTFWITLTVGLLIFYISGVTYTVRSVDRKYWQLMKGARHEE